MNGTRAVFSRTHFTLGWQIYLRKYSDGKTWQPSGIDIQWEECHEHSMIKQPLFVDTLDSYDSPDKQSSLYGENEALKNEVKFLREQINMMLKLKV
jgi:hypothetical protein